MRYEFERRKSRTVPRFLIYIGMIVIIELIAAVFLPELFSASHSILSFAAFFVIGFVISWISDRSGVFDKTVVVKIEVKEGGVGIDEEGKGEDIPYANIFGVHSGEHWMAPKYSLTINHFSKDVDMDELDSGRDASKVLHGLVLLAQGKVRFRTYAIERGMAEEIEKEIKSRLPGHIKRVQVAPAFSGLGVDAGVFKGNVPVSHGGIGKEKPKK